MLVYSAQHLTDNRKHTKFQLYRAFFLFDEDHVGSKHDVFVIDNKILDAVLQCADILSHFHTTTPD